MRGFVVWGWARAYKCFTNYDMNANVYWVIISAERNVLISVGGHFLEYPSANGILLRPSPSGTANSYTGETTNASCVAHLVQAFIANNWKPFLHFSTLSTRPCWAVSFSITYITD